MNLSSEDELSLRELKKILKDTDTCQCSDIGERTLKNRQQRYPQENVGSD